MLIGLIRATKMTGIWAKIWIIAHLASYSLGTMNKRKIQLLYYFSPLVLFSYFNLISVKPLSSMPFHPSAKDHTQPPQLRVKTRTASWMMTSQCDLGDWQLSPGCCLEGELGAARLCLHRTSTVGKAASARTKTNWSCEVVFVGFLGGTSHQTKKRE